MRPARPIVVQRGGPDFGPLQNLLALAFLYEQERRRSAETQLNATAEEFGSTLLALRRVLEPEGAMPDILPSLADHIFALSRASGVAIALVEGDCITCVAASGPIAPPPGTPVVREKGISGECLRTGRSIYCADTESDPRVNVAECRAGQIRSVMAVPIGPASGALGLIELFGAQPNAFGERELDILEVLAALLAHRIQAPNGCPPTAAAPEAAEEPPSAQVIEAPAITGPAITPEVRPAGAPEFPPDRIKVDLIKVRLQLPATAARQWIWGLLVSVLISAVVWAGLHIVAGKRSVTPAPRETAAPRMQPEPQLAIAGATPVIPAVRAVKYSSKPEFTSIAIETTGPVSVRAARLHHPERVYFDVAGVLLPAAIPGQIEVGDEFVDRIRSAQKTKDTTRIVVDLKCACDYGYVMSAGPPFRLVIDIQPPQRLRPPTSKPESRAFHKVSQRDLRRKTPQSL